MFRVSFRQIFGGPGSSSDGDYIRRIIDDGSSDSDDDGKRLMQITGGKRKATDFLLSEVNCFL